MLAVRAPPPDAAVIELQRLLRPLLVPGRVALLSKRVAEVAQGDEHAEGPAAAAEAFLRCCHEALCLPPSSDGEMRNAVTQWLRSRCGAPAAGPALLGLSPADLAGLLQASGVLRAVPRHLLRKAHKGGVLPAAPACCITEHWLRALMAAGAWDKRVAKLSAAAACESLLAALPCPPDQTCILRVEDAALAGEVLRKERIPLRSVPAALRSWYSDGARCAVAIPTDPVMAQQRAKTLQEGSPAEAAAAAEARDAEIAEVGYYSERTEWKPLPVRGATAFRVLPLGAVLRQRLSQAEGPQQLADAAVWAFGLVDAAGGRGLHEWLSELTVGDSPRLRAAAPWIALLRSRLENPPAPPRRSLPAAPILHGASTLGELSPRQLSRQLQVEVNPLRCDMTDASLLSPASGIMSSPSIASPASGADSRRQSKVGARRTSLPPKRDSLGSDSAQSARPVPRPESPRKVVMRPPQAAVLGDPIPVSREPGALWAAVAVPMRWSNFLPQQRYDLGDVVGIRRSAAEHAGGQATPREATVVELGPLAPLAHDMEEEALGGAPSSGVESPGRLPLVMRLRRGAQQLPPPGRHGRRAPPPPAGPHDDYATEQAPQLVGGRTPAPIPALYTPGARVVWPSAVRVAAAPPQQPVGEAPAGASWLLFELRGARRVPLPEGAALILPYSRWEVEDHGGDPSPLPGATLVRLRELPPVLPADGKVRRGVLMLDPCGVLGADFRRQLFHRTLPRLWHEDDEADEQSGVPPTAVMGTCDVLGVFNRVDDAVAWLKEQNATFSGSVVWNIAAADGPACEQMLREVCGAARPADGLARGCRFVVYTPDTVRLPLLQERWETHGCPSGCSVCVTADRDAAAAYATHCPYLPPRDNWVPLPDFLCMVYRSAAVRGLTYAWKPYRRGVQYGGAELRPRRDFSVLPPGVARRAELLSFRIERAQLGRPTLWPELIAQGMEKVLPMRPFD